MVRHRGLYLGLGLQGERVGRGVRQVRVGLCWIILLLLDKHRIARHLYVRLPNGARKFLALRERRLFGLRIGSDVRLNQSCQKDVWGEMKRATRTLLRWTKDLILGGITIRRMAEVWEGV